MVVVTNKGDKVCICNIFYTLQLKDYCFRVTATDPKQVENTTSTGQKVRRLEEQVSRLQVEERQKQVPCRTCPRKTHREGNKCPGLSQSCYACGQESHFKGAQICKGPDPKSDKKGDWKKGEQSGELRVRPK